MLGLWRVTVLWLGALVYGVTVPRVKRWEGATAEWSPTRAVSLAGAGGWDGTAFGLDAAQQYTHKRLNGIEERLHAGLDALLTDVYRWRDA